MSLKIENIINSATSFSTIREIVEKAKPEISWLGSRYISADGYQGTISIDALIFRVIEMVKKNPHFSEPERTHGKKIAKHIDRICEQSDLRMKNVNCLTKLLAIIRSIFKTMCGYGSSILEWQDFGHNKLFDYYTAEQYQNVFGALPPDYDDDVEGCEWGVTGFPDRWHPPEAKA